MGSLRIWWAILFVLAVACSGGVADTPGALPATTTSGAGTSGAGTSGAGTSGAGTSGVGTSTGGPSDGSVAVATTSAVSADCPAGGGTAWNHEASNEAITILERDDGLRVDLVEYPLPDYEGRPWSHWGQGIVASDGRLISAVGDHHGFDGNSFFFAFDPETSTLVRFSDVLSHTEHEPGEFGYGKVHAQMVAGPCSDVYAHTYWGSRRNLEYDDSYRGDLLFRIDSNSELIELVGIPEERRGTASMAASPDGRVLYLEAVEPVSNQTDLVIYDVLDREKIATIVDPDHTGRRALGVSSEGSVFFSSGNRGLSTYDPVTGEVRDTGSSIPGDMLRAVTDPGPDGRMVAVSRNPDEFFTIDPAGNVEALGAAPGYTASLAMSPDGRHVYLIPGAHGNSWESGTPLLDLDPATGDIKTVVELAGPVSDAAGVRAGGTYSIVMDPGGQRLYVSLNVGEGDESFGRVFLAIVHLPQ